MTQQDQQMKDETRHTKVAIIGSGPAGFSAGVYASRALLKPILFEGEVSDVIRPGGQLTTTTEVENYLGYKTIGGYELTEKFREHAKEYGTEIVGETVTKVDFKAQPFQLETHTGKQFTADKVIVATGAYAKKLDFPGVEKYWNNGISACATCDGALFRGVPLAIIGGGDSACEEALFLTRFGTKVTMLIRRDVMRASKIMQERVKKNSKIEIMWNTVAVEVQGDKEGMNLLKIKNVKTDKVSDLKVNGLFFAIGHQPFTKLFEGQLKLDNEGYIITEPGSTRTNVYGVHACGDVQDKIYRQAITSAGTGASASILVERELEADEFKKQKEEK